MSLVQRRGHTDGASNPSAVATLEVESLRGEYPSAIDDRPLDVEVHGVEEARRQAVETVTSLPPTVPAEPSAIVPQAPELRGLARAMCIAITVINAAVAGIAAY